MRRYLAPIIRWGVLGLFAIFTLGILSKGLDEEPPRANAKTVSATPSAPQTVNESGRGAFSPEVTAIIADLDGEFQRLWERDGLQHAETADWLTICRRLSLALVGTGMSLEEVRSLQAIPEDQRVSVHRERLLADQRFADYWAERLARTVVGADEGPFLVYRRRRFVTWLSEQISSNRPYDQIVRSLLTAQGYFTDRPEVNFVTVTMDSGIEEGQPDPIRLAGRTTRAFLGMRIDCLQCHDDFLGNVELGTPSDPRGGTQEDFHQLAAFFSEARFNPMQGIRTDAHPYKYQYLHADAATEVAPRVPFAEELVPAEGNARERLAQWVTHPQNRQASRAFANRVWALMFGQPLHQPVDDIPLHGPLPTGLDRLADGVIELKWDLRQLIRAISSTAVFTIDSRADFEVTEREESAWAVFPLIRLRPEQVARSLAQASRLTTIDDSAAFVLQLIAFGVENDFVTRYGDTGEDEFDQDSITITQRLLMMNGDLVRERTENNPILNASSHISMFAQSDEDAIDAVYLAVLNRMPSSTENTHFTKRFTETNNRQQAVEDLYWVLLNSSELTWNH